jgi:hypothetical protein
MLLTGVATWLLHPFATTLQIGAGDALWYANMLADFVTQLRAGVFPIFVGQTDYAFNGAVYPLRVAPFYQHLAGVLDLLTGRQLGIFALQHLCVLVVGYAGIFSSYFALNSLAAGQRWSAAGLATLYLSYTSLLGTILRTRFVHDVDDNPVCALGCMRNCPTVYRRLAQNSHHPRRAGQLTSWA